MKRILILGLMVLSVTACSRVQGTMERVGLGGGGGLGLRKDKVEVDGTRYNARLSADKEDRRNFTVTVTPFAVNPEGALEAGRFEATKYCLRGFGGSDAEWTQGPDDPADSLTPVDDTITLLGRCTQR